MPHAHRVSGQRIGALPGACRRWLCGRLHTQERSRADRERARGLRRAQARQDRPGAVLSQRQLGAAVHLAQIVRRTARRACALRKCAGAAGRGGSGRLPPGRLRCARRRAIAKGAVVRIRRPQRIVRRTACANRRCAVAGTGAAPASSRRARPVDRPARRTGAPAFQYQYPQADRFGARVRSHRRCRIGRRSALLLAHRRRPPHLCDRRQRRPRIFSAAGQHLEIPYRTDLRALRQLQHAQAHPPPVSMGPAGGAVRLLRAHAAQPCDGTAASTHRHVYLHDAAAGRRSAWLVVAVRRFLVLRRQRHGSARAVRRFHLLAGRAGRLCQLIRALHGARRRRAKHDLAQRLAGAGQRLAAHRWRAASATHARTARAGLGATTAPATQWPTCRWQRQRWLSTHHARLAARRYPEPVVRYAAAPGIHPGRSRLGLGAARPAGARRGSGRCRQAVVGQDPGIDRRPGSSATPAASAGQASLRLHRWRAAVAVFAVLRPVRPPQRGLPGTPRRRRMATTPGRTGGSRGEARRTRPPRTRSHRVGR